MKKPTNDTLTIELANLKAENALLTTRCRLLTTRSKLLTYITDRLCVKSVIHNEVKHTTVVFFRDGSKCIVKLAKGDRGDIYSAVAYAIAEQIYGSNSAFKREVDKYVNCH